MDCKERLVKYLREHNVPFEAQTHPEAYTAQEVAAVQHVSGHQMAKVVMVWADADLTMLVVPASGRVDLRAAARLLQVKRVRLATEGEFSQHFPDCKVGAMPPFGNLYDLPVHVDRALTEHAEIVFRVGTYTETMKIGYADFERLAEPVAGDFIFEL
jgi:Ala-tRNA(Pro) deacylase